MPKQSVQYIDAAPAATVSIHLDHLMLPTRDKLASAKLLAGRRV